MPPCALVDDGRPLPAAQGSAGADVGAADLLAPDAAPAADELYADRDHHG